MGTLKLAGDAYARRAWAEAYARLTAADADQPLSPNHFEQLAVAAH
jgi:hypothetical protein